MNILGKIIDTILTRRIQYIMETCELLPYTYIGGRKNLSYEYTIYLLIEKVYKVWRRKKVVSLLMLDVSGVFDNMLYIRLLHNLWKQGLLLQLVHWI